LKGGSESASSVDSEIQQTDGKNRNTNSGDGTRHSLIEGLIRALPKGGDDWPLSRGRSGSKRLAMNFDFVYQNSPPPTTDLGIDVFKRER
jgi:hypothetical protein